MPKGFEGLRQASKEIESRRSSGGFLKLENGESATVRFLEQGEDIHWCWAHEVPKAQGKGVTFVPCRDKKNEGEPCPGCERDLKKKVRAYLNVIWRNGPKFKKDGDSYVEEGKADGVFVWEQGIQTMDNLGDKDVKYKGLMSRDFEITRKGEGLNTKYVIEPADVDGGPQPLTDDDEKLAAKKPDLTNKIEPPSYEEFLRIIQGMPAQKQEGEDRQVTPNMFLRDD